MGGRVDVETDDITQLGGELWIGGELEPAEAMRLKPVCPPGALHRGDADAGDLGYGGGGPVGCLARRIAERAGDYGLGHRLGQGRNAGRARLVARQAVDTIGGEAFLPVPDRGLGNPGLAHDGVGALPIGGQQHDPATLDMLLRAVAIRDDGLQTGSSTGLTVKLIPGRMLQTRITAIDGESLNGLFR